MADGRFVDSLPPPELWPDLVFDLPELQYPARLNLATELLDNHVAAGRGGRTAIVFERQRISYRDLQRITNQIANVLRGLGVVPGDRVAMRFPNRPIFAASWLAVQKIGAIGVGTMPMLRARELADIVNDSGAKAFLCAADLHAELEKARPAFDHPVKIVLSGSAAETAPTGDVESLEALLLNAAEGCDAHEANREDVSIIAYTSGSTGTPKGTTHTAVDILAAADGYARHVLRPTADDVFGGHPTLAFTFGLGGLLIFPLRVGASTVFLDRFTPQALLETSARERVTILFCSATSYRMLLQDPDLERKYDLSALRACVSAGEPLPAPVFDEWKRRTGIEILDGIGSTEMFYIFISARQGKVKPGATGTPVPGYQARVVDDEMHEVPRGTPGLVAVKGPTGCRYWRKPDRQRQYVRQGWNLTGDVYVQDTDGYFWYQCRNDDLIITGGYNIAGPEVESVLLEHPAVLEAAVIASPDDVRGFIPKAVVVLKPGAPAPGDALVRELQEHVKRELAPYKYPREIEFVDALPKTETGKLRRAELRERERKLKAKEK